jgi:hypothetical protein
MKNKRIFALYVKRDIAINDCDEYAVAVRYWRGVIQAMKYCKVPCYIVELDVNGDVIRDPKYGQPIILKSKNWRKEHATTI